MTKLHLIIGPMKSGKSEELQRLMKRCDIAKKPYQLILPKVEGRPRDIYHERAWYATTEEARREAMDLDKAPRLFVDEGQFFDTLLWTLKWDDVTIAALNGTAELHQWPAVSEIFPFITSIQFIPAVCDRCGEPASYSSFKGGKTERVVIGDAEYEALCPHCYETVKSGELMYKYGNK